MNTEFTIPRYLFNTQHRLIIASDGDLKDYGSNKTLIPPLSNPCLMDDGQHILFTPWELSIKEQPAWYHRQPDGCWVPSDIKLSPACTNALFLAYTDQHLVTDHMEKLSYLPPDWVKASWWHAVVDFLSLKGVRHHLQFWNKHTGQLARTFCLPESGSIDPQAFFFALRERVQLSEDGNWLLHTMHDTLTLWDVSGSRSWWCWSAIATLFALATWSAWPRKSLQPS
ncbi:MAG: hypothetical protein U0796_04640 [Gemmatales bacterium]